MKPKTRWTILPTVTILFLAVAGVAHGQTQTVQLTKPVQPVSIQGTSGGTNSSSCGNIAASPNVIVDVTENIGSMRVTVQSEGQPTLFIEGPQGKACIPGDRTSGGRIEIPGFWKQGRYAIYIGDRAGGNHSYTLSISTN